MNRNVTALILIILAIGIYVTFTRTRIAEVKGIQAVNSQYSTAIKNADTLRAERDEILEKYNKISKNDRDRLDKIIPNTVDTIRLIIDLKGIASDNGLTLRGVKATASPNAQKPTAPVSGSANSSKGAIPTPVLDTVAVSFSVTASYQQFISFMQDLESSLRIIDLTHLTVAVTPSGLYEYTVDLKTYWLRQQ